MRLQRALARAGVASRRASEALIRGGKVKVNGRVASVGTVVDPEQDRITVGGRPVRPVRSAWLALHKPVGCVVTRRDARGRPTVFELVPELPGLTYVGRLDVMTSGLLVLTTDGEAVHRLTHPSFGIERRYRVIVSGRPVAEIRRALRVDPVIDGRPVRLHRHRVREMDGGRTVVELALGEGRNRIVRRIARHLGLRVERLARTGYGTLALGRLEPGRWRYLTKAEIHALTGAQAP